MEKLILVVEDNLINQELLTDILERVLVCRVILASDGQEAVDMAVSNLPHLILMDVGLPVMSGIEAMEKIKSHDKTRHIPIMALTGYSSPADEQKMMKKGFDGFLPKPFDIPLLLEKIKGVLDIKQGVNPV